MGLRPNRSDSRASSARPKTMRPNSTKTSATWLDVAASIAEVRQSNHFGADGGRR